MALSSWLSSAGSKLQKLHIEFGRYPIIPIEELRTLILGLPNLTELMIGTTELLSDVMDVLSNNLNLDICPKLTTLKFITARLTLMLWIKCSEVARNFLDSQTRLTSFDISKPKENIGLTKMVMQRVVTLIIVHTLKNYKMIILY
ncbi:hypothetical protein M422DRAFT_56004 [Sphaerobolus stellatus SS14]|uniref:Uncharacterized protein n=1 Tax=Sphaerobolus stellatus (strain SS14) TaxID=990650 RepID=A0A0C9UJG7_SPHS4|nr:hypothetical protein M422DRAFT_56004 [Sphaerobolus stellatus SS14]